MVLSIELEQEVTTIMVFRLHERNGTTVQLNFNDYELTSTGNWLTDLDHSCTEEMWNGDSFRLGFFDPIYLTDKEKEDIKLLYATEPGTVPVWKP